MLLATEDLNELADAKRRDQWRLLREYLRESAYETSRIRELLTPSEHVGDELTLTNRGPLASRFSGALAARDDPISILTRLFFFSAGVDLAGYRRLPGELQKLLEDLGCVRLRASEVEPRVAVCEYQSKYFVTDLHFFQSSTGEFVTVKPPTGAELCTSINASTFELYLRLDRRGLEESLLDVGSGSGCISILSAPHYAQTYGIDANPRAVVYSRINAMLNCVNAAFDTGDCLKPNGIRRFTHVAFNSNPEIGLAFIENSLAAALAPNGRAQVWVLLFLTEAASTPEAYVSAKAPHAIETFHMTAGCNPLSRFRLTRSQIDEGDIPRDYPLIEHPGLLPRPGRKEHLLKYFREMDVVEACSTLLTLRFPDTRERAGFHNGVVNTRSDRPKEAPDARSGLRRGIT